MFPCVSDAICPSRAAFSRYSSEFVRMRTICCFRACLPVQGPFFTQRVILVCCVGLGRLFLTLISRYTALSRIFAQIHAIFDNTLVFSRPRTVIYNRSRVNCTQTSVYSARIAYNTQQPVDTLEQDYFPVRERLVVRASSIGSSVGLRLFLRLGSMSALFCR